MNTANVLLLLLKVAIIVLSIIALIVLVDTLKEKKQYREDMWVYEEVYHINDVHSETLKALGIDEVFYFDWQETAHSLGIPIDSLTVNMFLKHILHDTLQ